MIQSALIFTLIFTNLKKQIFEICQFQNVVQSVRTYQLLRSFHPLLALWYYLYSSPLKQVWKKPIYFGKKKNYHQEHTPVNYQVHVFLLYADPEFANGCQRQYQLSQGSFQKQIVSRSDAAYYFVNKHCTWLFDKEKQICISVAN